MFAAIPATIVEQSEVVSPGLAFFYSRYRKGGACTCFLVPPPMNKCFDALAVLVDCTNLEVALHVCAHLVERPATRQVELVPDARTVLVHLASIKQAHAFMSALSGDVRTHRQTITIDAIYDGQDVIDVASLLSISQDAVVMPIPPGISRQLL